MDNFLLVLTSCEAIGDFAACSERTTQTQSADHEDGANNTII